MSGPVPRNALKQLTDGGERERQDDPVGLRELEGALDRRVCGAPVAERIAGGGVEKSSTGRVSSPLSVPAKKPRAKNVPA